MVWRGSGVKNLFYTPYHELDHDSIVILIRNRKVDCLPTGKVVVYAFRELPGLLTNDFARVEGSAHRELFALDGG